jgi:hypothetical protein
MMIAKEPMTHFLSRINYTVGRGTIRTKRAIRKVRKPPFHLNERLTAQQGVFLCPADLCVSFADNLKAMSNWASESNVVKLRLELDDRSAIEFARNLKSMNLSFAALFPGLEGFARSIGQQMFHYHELAENRAGHPPRSE